MRVFVGYSWLVLYEKGITMTTITFELAAELYRQLREVAHREGKASELLVQEWVIERLTTNAPALSERERVQQALRAAGLLVEPTPEEVALAAPAPVTLEEVQAAFARAPGQPLSEKDKV